MKMNVPTGNDFCPQTLFLYGTYDENGTPNFGLFCWLSYCWDGEMGVMACIGGEKLTKQRIKATGVFSANLVTEKLLPLADWLGNTQGKSGAKKELGLNIEKGRVLDVPTLCDSPVTFELEVAKSIPMDNGEVFLCKVRNTMMDESLLNENVSIEERIASIAPLSTASSTYFGWNGKSLGGWGEPKKDFKA